MAFSAEHILCLCIAVGSAVLCSALARRMTGSLIGYGVYAAVHAAGVASGFLFLFLAGR